MRGIIINDKTGEILGEIKDGDRLIRNKSIEAYKSIETAPKHETFTKIYHAVIPLLVGCKLTSSELILFIHLASNLKYLSNVAKYDNGRMITRDNITKDLQLNEKTVRRSISKLIKEGLIVEAGTIEGKVFIVNPYIVMVGDKINKTVFDLFRKSKWARW